MKKTRQYNLLSALLSLFTTVRAGLTWNIPGRQAIMLAVIMTTPKSYSFLLVISLNIFFCCRDNNGTRLVSRTINSNQGIAIDSLNFINDGPKDFTLEYFPVKTIRLAGVRECLITEQDSVSKRVARTVQFDKNGNIIKDENNFFSWWFEGKMRGNYNYQYDETGRKLIMKGISQEDTKDSVMTIWNYNSNGLLLSRDAYEFSKKLKPGGDRHLPGPNDYEKNPTWNKVQSYRFSHRADSLTIETFAGNKSVNKENYQLYFDSSKKLKQVIKFENGSLVKTTDYTFEAGSITGYVKRKINDGTEWTYKSKIILNDKGNLIEKVVFESDDSEVKMIVSYIANGTIKTIKCNNTIQEFQYSYY